MDDDGTVGSTGAGVESATEAPAPHPPPEARNTALPPAPTRSGRRGIIVVAAVVVLVLIAGALAAVSLSGSDGPDGSDAASASASSTGSPSVSVAAPTGLSGKASGPFRVMLRWQTASAASDHITVSRNGEVVATLPGTTSRWVDATALPAQRYHYTVQAVGSSGAQSSAVTTAVRTPKAPLADARVVGVYQATLTVTSKYGYTSLASPQKAGWRFRPVCQQGSCDVQWQILHVKDFQPRLGRAGASYKGGAAAKYNTTCSGVQLTSSLSVDVHATNAEVIRDAWVATELAGTFTERTGAQLGCVGSGVDFAVRAKLYR
jgi:hypothetical protein